MNTLAQQLDDWIFIMKEMKEDLPGGMYRYRILSQVIEFLHQSRTNEMLSVTTQMALTDPNPVRRLDLIQRDLERFSARISRVENSTVVHRQCISEVNKRLDQLEQS